MPPWPERFGTPAPIAAASALIFVQHRTWHRDWRKRNLADSVLPLNLLLSGQQCIWPHKDALPCPLDTTFEPDKKELISRGDGSASPANGGGRCLAQAKLSHRPYLEDEKHEKH